MGIVTLKIYLTHLPPLISSPTLGLFPLLCSGHTSQAFSDQVGLAHKLVLSSASFSWCWWLLPDLKCCAAVLSTPPTQHGYEGSGNARDHPHTLSLQLVGEGLLLPNSDHNIETGQNHSSSCHITFQGRTICCLSGSL